MFPVTAQLPTNWGGDSKKAAKLEPWAEKLLEKRDAKGSASSQEPLLPVAGGAQDCELHIEDDLEWQDDPQIQSLLQEYKDMLQEPGHRHDDFGVSVLSGQWQLQRKGIIADAFRASVRGEESTAWCRARGLNASARYEISFYGDTSAAVLARTWAAKMQYMLNVCLARGDSNLVFSAEILSAWPEPSEFTQLAEGCNSDPNRRLASRIRQIRDLH